MRRFTVISMIVLGSALLFLTGESSQTFAQKKRAGAAAEQAHSVKMESSIHEVLAGLQGMQTNQGLLLKVGSDFVTFEHEGDTLCFPIHSLQGIKFLKAEEGGDRKIEIRFLSKD
jgi:hypothetical protein